MCDSTDVNGILISIYLEYFAAPVCLYHGMTDFQQTILQVANKHGMTVFCDYNEMVLKKEISRMVLEISLVFIHVS